MSDEIWKAAIAGAVTLGSAIVTVVGAVLLRRIGTLRQLVKEPPPMAPDDSATALLLALLRRRTEGLLNATTLTEAHRLTIDLDMLLRELQEAERAAGHFVRLRS